MLLKILLNVYPVLQIQELTSENVWESWYEYIVLLKPPKTFLFEKQRSD